MDTRGKSAIQTDVEDDQVKEKTLSARDQLMEQIGERRETELTGQSNDELDAEAEAAAAAKAQREAENSNLIEVTVDGKKLNLPLSDIVKGYQKDNVASKRLEEAANRKKELDDREVKLLAGEDQLKKQLEAGTLTGEEEGDDDLVTSLDAFVQDGNSEQTAAVIRKEIEKALKKATPSMPKEELAAAVDEKLAVEDAKRAKAAQDVEHQAANKDFVEKFPDLMSDPDLLAAANRRFYAKVGEGKSITDAMAEAGAETKDWMNGNRTNSPREVKQLRKGTIDSLPQVGARSVAKLDLDNVVQSPSEIISEMRKSRGLVV
jgi:flavodoxin